MPIHDFSFETKAINPDTGKPYYFVVVRFKGTESISSLYRYEITMMTFEEEVNIDKMLEVPATFYMSEDKVNPIHGILASFESLHEGSSPGGRNYYVYKAVLVPKMWRLTLNKESRLFVGPENNNLGDGLTKDPSDGQIKDKDGNPKPITPGHTISKDRQTLLSDLRAHLRLKI